MDYKVSKQTLPYILPHSDLIHKFHRFHLLLDEDCQKEMPSIQLLGQFSEDALFQWDFYQSVYLQLQMMLFYSLLQHSGEIKQNIKKIFLKSLQGFDLCIKHIFQNKYLKMDILLFILYHTKFIKTKLLILKAGL